MCDRSVFAYATAQFSHILFKVSNACYSYIGLYRTYIHKKHKKKFIHILYAAAQASWFLATLLTKNHNILLLQLIVTVTEQ